MSPIWFVPLAVAGVGAVAASIWARLLARDVEKVRRSLRPLRATRVSRSNRPT